jgi:hypothetical protein
VANRTQQLYWVFLYNDFVLETDPIKLHARLGSLEDAIFERLRELAGALNSYAEKIAIKEACRRILQVKIEKLGFPPVCLAARGASSGFPASRAT